MMLLLKRNIFFTDCNYAKLISLLFKLASFSILKVLFYESIWISYH
jgi:hypothetical protein